MIREKTRMALVGRFVMDMLGNLSNEERGRLVKGYLEATSRLLQDVEINAVKLGHGEAYNHIHHLVSDPTTVPPADSGDECQRACLEALSKLTKVVAPKAAKGRRR